MVTMSTRKLVKTLDGHNLKNEFGDRYCLLLESNKTLKVGVHMKKMCIFETTVKTRLSVNTIANYISLESL